ncbi:hypothetical protein ACN47E_010295 [Coniothyrium glycines]
MVDSKISSKHVEEVGVIMQEHITQHNAARSRLLRLPAEIRMRIYDFVFLNSPIHLKTGAFRSQHLRRSEIDQLASLGLLVTCRQLHHEAMPAFHKHCIIKFRMHDCVYWNKPWLLPTPDVNKFIKNIMVPRSCIHWFVLRNSSKNENEVFPALKRLQIQSDKYLLLDHDYLKKFVRENFGRPDLEVEIGNFRMY